MNGFGLLFILIYFNNNFFKLLNINSENPHLITYKFVSSCTLTVIFTVVLSSTYLPEIFTVNLREMSKSVVYCLKIQKKLLWNKSILSKESKEYLLQYYKHLLMISIDSIRNFTAFFVSFFNLHVNSCWDDQDYKTPKCNFARWYNRKRVKNNFIIFFHRFYKSCM